MKNYDVIVLGGGPGGYVAAIAAASSGKKTAIVERDNLGGTCLNWGCIPTKSLLRNAEIIRELFEGKKFGFEILGDVHVDYESAYKRSREVSARLVRGINYLMKKNKIDVYKDTAAFSGRKELTLKDSGEKLRSENIIIATGSKPARLPFLDYAKENILDSKKALQLTKAPKSIVIIGAGAIGMEFATLFRSYGAEVTVIEMLPHILPNEDAEIAAYVEKQYREMGMTVYANTKVTGVQHVGDMIEVSLEGKDSVVAEYLLAATGIRPETAELCLDKAGVLTDARGYIPVDSNMETNAEGIYAIGDVNGRLALAHKASAEALHAAKAIKGEVGEPLNYDNMPRCTYSLPEVASAGITLEKAREQGIDADAAVFPLSANGKAISYGQDSGMMKLVYDKTDGTLLGAFFAGIHVTEMIWGIVGYLGLEMTVEEMTRVVHPHPTVSEAIMEAAHAAHGMPIHI